MHESFNNRFWSSELGYCYDVVDKEGGGNDSSLRPNQVLGISLPHAVLAEEKWKPVLGIVREKLLTPFGLRSLAPGDPTTSLDTTEICWHAMPLITKVLSGHGSSAPSLMPGFALILAIGRLRAPCSPASMPR